MKRRSAAWVVSAAAAPVLVSVGVIGLVVEPSQLLWSVVLGAIVGGGVHLWNLERAGAGSTSPVLCDSVALAGLSTVAACAVVTGVVIVFGAVSGPVIIALAFASAPWAWRRMRLVYRLATAVRDERVPRRAVSARVALEAHIAAADLSVDELCLAWRRSYLVLIETPFGAGHAEVVSRRRELLDELERRDHAGFGRWIDTGARAASDPGRYLSTEP